MVRFDSVHKITIAIKEVQFLNIKIEIKPNTVGAVQFPNGAISIF